MTCSTPSPAGSHHDPHSVLGMHLGTDAEGAPEWTIRARRPLAKSVTAVFADGTRVPLDARPRAASGKASDRATAARTSSSRPTTDAPDYAADDPYRLRPGDRRARPAPDPRGPSRASCGTCSARTSASIDGIDGHVVRGLGAERPRRARRRRLQQLGRRGARDALDGRQRRLGAVRSRRRRRARPTSSSSSRAAATGSSRPTRWRATRRCRRRRHPSSPIRRTPGPTRLDDRARRDASPSRSRCRSTRCTSARGGPGLVYRDVADQLIEYVHRRRASRTSSSCRSPSTRSAARGATRSRATTPRPAASARPTTCAT